jgi:hypothetical protein
MATAVQVESLWNGLTDNSGQPLGAGKVYTYAAGTMTPVSLYTASDKTSSATNPLILDANGKAQVWADGRYKFVVKTAADVTLYTLDNLLYGFDDTTVLLGGTSTGSANAQVVSVPATVESYANGQRITFIAGFTNTGATTLQFNALSPISVVKGPVPSALQAGDLLAGQLYSCTYYGGSFYLENAPTPADVQRSRSQLITGISGTNTITGVTAPALTGYETGQVFRFKAVGANTGPTTININTRGAQTIQRYGVALVAGEIQNNDMVEIVYDGTQFQLVNATPAPLFIDRTNTRVGIGTTSPSQRLHVSDGTSTGDVRIMLGDATNNVQLIRNGATDAWIRFNGTDGIVDVATNKPLIFRTNALERMRIDSAGNVGIGTSPSYQLHLSTDSAAKLTTNTWTTTSDGRIKTNIQPYAKGLAEILQVSPVTYDYNGKGGIPAGPGGVSIIAQDLQPIFPECISSFKAKLEEADEEPTDILNYNGHAITFALINAIKELNTKIEALEAQLAALEP